MSVETQGMSVEGGVRELPATEARNQMSELLDHVADGEVVYLTRRGKRVAALLPADVAENYEAIEDAYWAQRAEAARTGETIPWEQAIAELESRGA